MATNPSTSLFDLFDTAPGLIREFLYSALQLRDLHNLYLRARGDGRESFSRSVLEYLNISVQVTLKDMEQIPKTGPVVVVANHPFGFLDGLVLDSALLQARPDIKILTNAMLCGIEGVGERFLPIEVLGTRKAANTNVRAVRHALEWLRSGKGLAVFPAGEVSHWNRTRRGITDSPWSDFPVRCARTAGAAILPIYFKGENSLAFQIAGLVHPSLRTARLPGELLNKRGRVVEVRIGTPINLAELAKNNSVESEIEYVRLRTYVLAHRQTRSAQTSRPRLAIMPKQVRRQPVAPGMKGLEAEIDQLADCGCAVVESGSYAVYAAKGSDVPRVVWEIGRLRELTFRAVREGTNRAVDIDKFDRYYTHLVLWDKQELRVVGSYRLAWTEDTLQLKGINGLYTSTLFRFAPGFFRQLGPAVELGRSFIRPEYQKEYLPLLLLWQAIARCVARRPSAPTLFGAVSISADYSPGARELIVQFLREHKFCNGLADLVSPRRPFRTHAMHASELHVIGECFKTVEDLSAPMQDMGNSSGIPVLLRQYLKLGGRVAAFNVDRGFSHCLDGLLIVDLRETSSKNLVKYMGPQLAAEFSKLARTAVVDHLGAQVEQASFCLEKR